MNAHRNTLFAVFKACLAVALLAMVTGSFFQVSAASAKSDKNKEPGTVVPDQGNEHISSPGAPHAPYNSDPPTSGPHTPYITQWGMHGEPVPKETQVHNLEDGGVIIQYRCNKPCEEMVRKLQLIASQYQRIVVAPYPDLDSLIAMTAWNRIDKLKEFDEKRITRFINAYIGIDHHPKSETGKP